MYKIETKYVVYFFFLIGTVKKKGKLQITTPKVLGCLDFIP